MTGFQPLQDTSSGSMNLAQINKMLAQLNHEQQIKVFKGAGGYNAIIEGRLPNDLGYGFQFNDSSETPRIVIYVNTDGEPVLKTSPTGVNASTADDEDLTFNSQRNVFKVIASGTFESPALDAAGGADDTSTVVTDTGIDSPTPLAYAAYVVNDSGGYNQLPFTAINYSGFYQLYRTMAVVLSGSDVQLHTYSQNFTGSPVDAVTIKYFLFAESIV